MREIYCRLQRSSLGRRVVHGTFWSLLGTLLSRGMGLLASIVVARALGKTGFGELGVIQSTVGMFGVLAGVGLGTTATKYVAEFRLTDRDRAGRVIALSSVTSWLSGAAVTAAFFFAAPWLATRTLNAPALVPQLQSGSLLVLLGAVSGAQTGALSGLEAFRIIARVNFWVGILSFPTLAAGVWAAGLSGAVWALIVNLGTNCLLNFSALRSQLRSNSIRVNWERFFAEISLLWKFSLPVTMVSLIMVPATWLTSMWLATSVHGYAAMGEFSVANQWRNLVMLVPMMLASVAIPMLSNLHAQGDRRAFRKVLLANFYSVAAVSGASALIIALAAPVIAAGYGPSFSGAIPVIRYMALAGFLIAVNSIAASVITSVGRAWVGFAFCAGCALVLIGCAWVFVPRYAATGLALATVLAYVAHTLWQGVFVYRAVRSR